MKLRQLYEQRLELDHLKKKLEEALLLHHELDKQSYYLRMDMEKEQKDVDKLEKKVLISFKKNTEDKLEKEKYEANQARIKYNNCMFEMKTTKLNIEHYQKKIDEINKNKKEYDRLLKEKRNLIKNSYLEELEEKYMSSKQRYMDAKEKLSEVNKSFSICKDAKELIRRLSGVSSSRISRRDSILERAFFYEDIDIAQKELNQLQKEMDKLKIDLIKLKNNEFYEKFANEKEKSFYHRFDKVTDLTVWETISTTLTQINEVYMKMQSMIDDLNNELENEKKIGKELKKEMDSIIVNA